MAKIFHDCTNPLGIHSLFRAPTDTILTVMIIDTLYLAKWSLQAASQVGHTATDDGATTSAIHSGLPSIRCAQPHGPRTAGLRVL